VPALWLALSFILHPVAAPSQSNHYIKLTCLPDRLRVADTILYGDLPAEAERRAMDENHDGVISPAEAAAFGARVARAIAAHSALEVDGRKLALAFEADVGFGGDRSLRAAPFSVDLVAMIPLAPAPAHEVRFDDRYEPARAGESELAIEEAPGTRVVASQRGHEAAEVLHGLRFSYPAPRRSDLEDRSIWFRFVAERAAVARAPARGAASWAVLASVVAVTLVVAVALWWRRFGRAT
jgi:hypothetical protein